MSVFVFLARWDPRLSLSLSLSLSLFQFFRNPKNLTDMSLVSTDRDNDITKLKKEKRNWIHLQRDFQFIHRFVWPMLTYHYFCLKTVLQMGQTWPLFINFGPFLIMMTNIGSTIDFELKKLRWIQTLDWRMAQKNPLDHNKFKKSLFLIFDECVFHDAKRSSFTNNRQPWYRDRHSSLSHLSGCYGVARRQCSCTLIQRRLYKRFRRTVQNL